MSKRITLLNNKGGVGKTLAAVALAEAAARRGRRVLVVDMDPQANATRRLGAQPGRGEPRGTLTGCLRMGVNEGAAKEYIVGHGWDDKDRALAIHVLPADLDLEDRVLEAGQLGAHFRLRQALFGVDDDYDLTVIDCPPSIKGHLTAMAISALDGMGDTVLVPLAPEHDAIGGALRAVRYVEYARDYLGVPHAEVTGLIVNNVRHGTTLHGVRLEQLRELMPFVPVVATVALRARIAEVQDAALPLGSEPELAGVLAEFDRLAEILMVRSDDDTA